MTREIVSGVLAILAGLGVVLTLLWRHQLHLARSSAGPAPQPLHLLGFLYGSFALFLVPAIVVGVAVGGMDGVAWKVIGSVGVPIILVFQGLDSLIYSARAAPNLPQRVWHWLFGPLCLALAAGLVYLYLGYVVAHWP